MLKLDVTTKLKPEQVIERALDFFGAGYGLEVTEHSASCVTFRGSGGGVTVNVSPASERTLVDLESREWDSVIRDFAEEIR
jgi:hypothetical protein